MAGDWIQWSKGLHRKPEVAQIARALGLDLYSAAARCMAVWEWVDENSPDGCNVRSVTDVTVSALLDSCAGVTGFATAMASVGWLIVHSDCIEFPNGDRWNGKTSKTRALGYQRIKRHREAVKRNCNAIDNAATVINFGLETETETYRNTIPPLPPQGEAVAGGTAPKPETKADKPAEPPPKEAKTVTPKWKPEDEQIPLTLQTPEFTAAWSKWIAHRAESKHRLTPTATRECLASCAAWGPAKAVESITQSITSGWRGLFEPKGNAAPGQPQLRVSSFETVAERNNRRRQETFDRIIAEEKAKEQARKATA
jgi:hypothetical protein